MFLRNFKIIREEKIISLDKIAKETSIDFKKLLKIEELKEEANQEELDKIAMCLDSNEFELTEKSFRHLSQGNLFSIIFGILGLILISFNVAYPGQSSEIFLVLNIVFSVSGIVLFFLYRNYKLSILFLVFGLLMLVPLPLNIFILSHN